MDELPENLQVIKSEQTTPEKYTNNIKERLNLHVKRRLLQEAHSSPTSMPFSTSAGMSAVTPQPMSTAAATASSNKIQEKTKEPQRVRRPYQRRAEKTNNKNLSMTSAAITPTSMVAGETTPSPTVPPENPVRKRRQKSKIPQQQLLQKQLPVVRSEDDGSMDGIADLEARPKDKDKTDVLGMVLSMKRRALLQDAEVQKFLRDIMSVIKN